MLTTFSIAAGTIVSLIGILTVLWKIAKSVTSTQLAVSNIEERLLEIRIILDKTDVRLDKVTEKSTKNEYRIETAECAIREIKDNCKEIQIEKRKEMAG